MVVIRFNIETSGQLIEKLNELKSAEYIFRGHEDARYLLIANAFRPDKIGSKLAQEYLISPSICAGWLNVSVQLTTSIINRRRLLS